MNERINEWEKKRFLVLFLYLFFQIERAKWEPLSVLDKLQVDTNRKTGTVKTFCSDSECLRFSHSFFATST